MKRPLRHSWLLALALPCIGQAGAQATGPSDQKVEATTAESLQRVEITGTVNDRKDATAAKIVVSRDEILRFGDANLGDVLSRVPGVTVSGAPGQDREVRFRGLGSGYTRVLVNGEPVPAGFSVDSIAPELIERIEVLRTATADLGTQGIAGTINIILRQRASVRQRDVEASISSQQGRLSPAISGQFSDRDGDYSYALDVSTKVERTLWASATDVESWDGDGTLLSRRQIRLNESTEQVSAAVSPRFTWKPDDGRSLGIEGLLQVRRRDYTGRTDRSTFFGTPPSLDSDSTRVRYAFSNLTLSANGRSSLGDDGSIEYKVTGSVFRRSLDGTLDGFDAVQTQLLHRAVNSDLTDRSLGGKGKYLASVSDAHTLAFGLEGRFGIRSEDKIQRESSNTGHPTLDLNEDYSAAVGQLAVYGQDEWQVTPELSSYFGLRWEGLETRTRGATLSPVRHLSSVFSPTLQLLWKIPNTKSDQLRVSIGRTYKAPTARELIPRRWIENDNSATSPDYQGNPNLRPELAWALDVGYERYLPGGGILGINVYQRIIDDVILDHVFLDGATWVSTPSNSGRAKAAGVEIEVKAALQSIWSQAPPVELRGSLSRHYSSVAQVKRPGNRLAEQPSLTGSLGADYRPKQWPVSVGGSLVLQRGDFVRLSNTTSIQTARKRNLDLYAVWSIDKASKLRLSLNNVMAPRSVSSATYQDAMQSQNQVTTSDSHRTVRLGYETRL